MDPLGLGFGLVSGLGFGFEFGLGSGLETGLETGLGLGLGLGSGLRLALGLVGAGSNVQRDRPYMDVCQHGDKGHCTTGLSQV